jgi:catechol 2,3-dioxygenase-like lactoylglutathione lyase family enzyme
LRGTVRCWSRRTDCNAEKRDELGPLSANISEYQPAFSLLWSSRSREKPRIAAADVDSFAVFFAAFNSDISKRLRQRGSLSKAKRDIVVTPGCRRTIRGTIMSFAIQHVHVKTKDPKQTMQFYIDNLGATYVAEIPGRGHRLNLHGLTLNITTLISAQNHEQHYGIEHIALDTDDYSGAMAKLRENGVRVLEELLSNNGRRVCFLEAPDGAQIELIEKVQPA